MITSYREFINENIREDGITTEEVEFLKKYNIKYEFNEETGMIDVANVDIKNNEMKKLPNIRLGKCYGHFLMYVNLELITMEHFPIEVEGNLYCATNNLTSLKFCSKIVGRTFNCDFNNITSLDHCPEYVGRKFSCDTNKLSSIEDYPMCWIGGMISDIFEFPKILSIVQKNPDRYRPFIESKDKIRFHQQVMRDDPSLVKEYVTISPPSRKTFI